MRLEALLKRTSTRAISGSGKVFDRNTSQFPLKRSARDSAFVGDKLVLESPVSTGKEGHATPNGTFAAGEKFRMHHSDLYDNAPMPYSVQIGGGYFIHGFSSVPAHPASHGCIRLPMEQAKQFFDWVEPGTPAIVTGKWPGRLTEEGKQARALRGKPQKIHHKRRRTAAPLVWLRHSPNSIRLC